MFLWLTWRSSQHPGRATVWRSNQQRSVKAWLPKHPINLDLGRVHSEEAVPLADQEGDYEDSSTARLIEVPLGFIVSTNVTDLKDYVSLWGSPWGISSSFTFCALSFNDFSFICHSYKWGKGGERRRNSIASKNMVLAESVTAGDLSALIGGWIRSWRMATCSGLMWSKGSCRLSPVFKAVSRSELRCQDTERSSAGGAWKLELNINVRAPDSHKLIIV